MDIELNAHEARVIGSLIEKQITTPDQYPMSLNSLANACNQKTNREPVMELTERDVQAAVDTLMRKYFVSDKSAGYGGRVTKYQQRFCNTQFGSLKFSPQELGIVDVLLLRGPQTPGELRQRTQRLCEFTDVGAVETALEGLTTREDGPFVVKLPRAPGSREARYAHLFSGPIDTEAMASAYAASAPAYASDDGSASAGSSAVTNHLAEALERIAQLENAVRGLREDVEALRGNR